jgi:GDP-4-dehydro-6-deoxy-D-mannose reductase
MRVLITGIGGFAGSHLAEYCLARSDHQVFGLVRSPGNPGHARDLLERGVQLIGADMRSASQVAQAVTASRPDIVFHLAGQAFVPQSFADPNGTFMDNAGGQLNLILALLRHAKDAKLLVVGSCLEYGLVRPDENPVDERVPLRPADPYAVSKVTQDMMGYQYFASNDMQIIRVRPFNHTGPRQREDFVAGRFARQIAEVEAEQRTPELEVGNMSAVRDFTDVRDMVRAYYLAVTKGVVGEVYNIGSGTGRRVDEVLRTLAAFSAIHFTIREQPSRLRPPDVPSLICNATRFRAQTGWEPLIPFERTMRDLLNYWRGVVGYRAEAQAELGITEAPMTAAETPPLALSEVGIVRPDAV